MDVLTRVVFGVMIWQWLVYIGGTISIMLLLQWVLTLFQKRLRSRAEETTTDLDDFFIVLIEKVYGLSLFTIGAWGIHFFLPLPTFLENWSSVFFLFVIYLQIGNWVTPLYKYLLRKLAHDEQGKSRETSFEMIVKILSWITYIILGVMAIDALPGVEITTLVTTMGIGGIAIAFALQNVLSDFAAALTIAFDQPFEEGDGILVDGLGGTVEKIGLKSTRIRSWDGQEIVIANSDLLNSRINNYKTLERRRVTLKFSVIYQTSADDLERIPSIVQEIVEGFEKVTYARTHSTSLINSSVDYESVYYVESADFNLYMDIRHQVNIALIRRFEEEGIKFAYPTRTIFMDN
ncbi:MAG: mechanosensitive ion channel family protein [Anaerolineae bacterium]|jgi:small-conductance mechanosensitive channel|nr:mechanosensitive ion channel family protein [Anaerolineae bacterium]